MNSFNYVLFFSFLLLVTVICGLPNNTTIIPSACNFLSNGWNYILPFDQATMDILTSSSSRKATPIYVYCSDGYTVINLYEDEKIQDYFSTIHEYLESASGPDLNDHVSWKQWWLPSLNIMLNSGDTSNEQNDDMVSWSVTDADCTKCLTEDKLKYGKETAYYMTPDIASCNWPTKGVCDFDLDTLECYECAALNQKVDITLSGKCGHVQLNASQITAEKHSECTEVVMSSYDAFLPSISTLNSYCVCYKPNDKYVNYYNVETAELTELEQIREYEEIQEDEEAEDSKINKIKTNTVYLSTKDFAEGTYRIRESGTYILTENIVFNPHGLTEEDILEGISPNSEGAWMPYADQYDEYPGADANDGWYWMGFFAAITVESSNVVVDLSNYEIKMDLSFFFQQRYFIVIHISNKPFADTQGPTWSGVGQIRELTNIEIKNGIIGLSSHIGIRGVECHDIYLNNLVIRDFETHGIVFNAFTNVELNYVEIGPSVLTQLPITGNYNLVRLSLPTFRHANDEIGDKTLQFFNRSAVTYSELYNKLITELDLVFKYIAYDDESVTNHEYWQEASSLFISELGISRSATIYGATFRSEGAEVFNLGTFRGDSPSYNLTLNYVKIHDLEIATQEIIGVGKLVAREMLNAPIPFSPATNNRFENYDEAMYVGNILTDILMALHELSNNWWYLNRFACDNQVCEDWVLKGIPLDEKISPLSCGWDTLGHIPKGAIGIKLEFIQGLTINNLDISNIHSISDLGTEMCGEWTDRENGGHMLQTAWSNKGYMGTHAFGMILHTVAGYMENVNIYNVASYYGPAYGFYMMMYNDIVIQNSKINNIFGGIMNKYDYSTDHLPNRANRACGIENNTINDIPGSVNTNHLVLRNVLQYCFNGHTGCNINSTNADKQYSSVNDYEHAIEHDNCNSTMLQFSDGNNIHVDEQSNIQILEKEATFWQKAKTANERNKHNNRHKAINKIIHFKFNKILLSMTIALIIILCGVLIICTNQHLNKQQKHSEKSNREFGIMTEHDPLLVHKL